MKIRAINVLELILFILYCASIFLHNAHIPFLSWITFLSCMFLGCLYWPLGFYTLKSPGVSTAYTVGASLLFSVSVVLVMFRVLKWPNFDIVFEVVISLYLATSLAIIGAYLITKRKTQPIVFNKWLLIRFATYFLFLVYAVLAYKSSQPR